MSVSSCNTRTESLERGSASVLEGRKRLAGYCRQLKTKRDFTYQLFDSKLKMKQILDKEFVHVFPW